MMCSLVYHKRWGNDITHHMIHFIGHTHALIKWFANDQFYLWDQNSQTIFQVNLP